MTPEEQIDGIILDVLTQAGIDAVADIQSDLDVAYPPASSPGEKPHRRNGFLHDQISTSVEQSGPVTLLYVVSLAPFSAYLENGTSKMEARPFMGPAQEKWAPIVHQRLTEAFSTSAPVLIH